MIDVKSKDLIFSETPVSYPQRMARGRIQRKNFLMEERIERERLNNISWAEERLKSQHKMEISKTKLEHRKNIFMYLYTHC